MPKYMPHMDSLALTTFPGALYTYTDIMIMVQDDSTTPDYIY